MGIGKGFMKETQLKIRDGLRKMVHYDHFSKTGLEFRNNSQDINSIILKLTKISEKDREIITSQSKISGNLYVENISNFEYFNSESISKIKINYLLLIIRTIRLLQCAVSSIFWSSKTY